MVVLRVVGGAFLGLDVGLDVEVHEVGVVVRSCVSVVAFVVNGFMKNLGLLSTKGDASM